ncbi:TonB-dependent receptor [Phenylobacterium sp.]|uniref:TonB-dependent receptor domain-containing protein n=1 Tax=Phenylobacterium sp. TaxID=1871053 RepID=UPI002736D3D6|nr:TonB-dependent receptor [Phenylobacterium sp.]MDP3660268.1 TonB-dependent receptor [Phenylobacterium sp.]
MILAAAVPQLEAPALAAEQGVIAYPASFFAGAAPTTALDMVQRVPGFAFDKGVAVRGLAGATGNVLINGEPPVAKNDTLDEILKRIPASSVERIELIRGGAGGVDMQGRAVLANVVLRSGAGFKGATTGSVAYFYDGRVFTNIRSEGSWRWPSGRSAEFSVYYGYLPDATYGDGQRVRYAPNRSIQILSDVEADGRVYRKFATGAFETPLAGGKLRLNGAFQPFTQDLDITDRLRVPGGVEYQHDTSVWDQAELGARYSRGLSARTSLEAVGFQQWKTNAQKSDFRGLTQRRFGLDRDIAESVGRAHIQFRQSPTISWEVGGEGAFNTLDVATTLAVNGAPVVLPAANVTVEEKRAEAFATVTWRINDHFNLEAGVRQERSEVTSSGDVNLSKTLQFTKPRALITWSPQAGDQFRVRVEREVGQLNFDDFVASSTVANTGVVIAGNPDLAPQQAWVFEAAYERRFGPSAAVILTARHSELDDVVDRIPLFFGGVPVADAPGNIGKGSKDELIANISLPLDRFGVSNARFKAQGTWRRSEVTDPLTGQKREISAVRPVEWDFHFVQDLPRWKSSWGLDIAPDAGIRERNFRLSEIENRKFDTWIDFFAEYKPRPDLLVRLEVLNLTERSFQRERIVYAGARDRTPLLYTEVRDLRWGRVLILRLRKSY